MNSFVSLAVYMFSLSWFLDSPSKLETASIELQLTQYQLDNGLRLILHPLPNSGVVQLELRYDVGEADVEVSGLAHLAEHLMVLRPLQQANQRVEGGDRNGWTSYDSTVFVHTFPAEALAQALEQESSRMRAPCNMIDPISVAKHKKILFYEHFAQVIESKKRPEDVFRSFLLEATHFHRQVYGTPSEFMQLGVASVCQYFKRWYLPNNAQLVMVGDFTMSEAVRLVFRLFSDIPRGESVARNPTARQQRNTLQMPKKISQQSSNGTVLYVGWPGVARGHGDEGVLNLLMRVLVHPSEGLLRRENINASGHVESYRFGGLLMMTLEADNNIHIEKALRRQLQRIRRLKKRHLRWFSHRILQRYQRALRYLSLRTSLVSRCARYPLRCPQAELEYGMQLSGVELQRVADNYFNLKKARFLSPEVVESLSYESP